MSNEEFITPEKARRELGEDAYWSFRSWLKDKGYNNLVSVAENKLVNKAYVTRSQLEEFVKEVLKEFKGNQPTESLWGQTREYWNGQKIRKKR